MNGIDMLMKNSNLNQSNNQKVNLDGKTDDPSLFNILLTQTSTSNDEFLSTGDGRTDSKTLNDLSLKQLKQLQTELEVSTPGDIKLNVDLDLIYSLKGQIEELTNQAEELIAQVIDGSDPKEVSGKLSKLLEEAVSLESIKNKLTDKGKLTQNSTGETVQALISNLEQILNGDSVPNLQMLTSGLDQLLNTTQLGEEDKNFLLLLREQVKTEEFDKADFKKLQSLLKELSGEIKATQEKSTNSYEVKDTKARAVWEDLVQTYKRRKGMETSAYRENATVTGKDISKWLTNAIETHTMGDKTPQVVPQQSVQQSQTSMPMTRLEQYVIHVSQTETSESAEQKVVNEMKKIIDMNRFMSQPNGRMQMSIALRPENLGEMNLRIVQINGEMTVKIAVSTNATKELLEKNLGQLRSIFSPHQVVIEKQDLTATSASDVQKEQSEQDDGLNEQQQNQNQNDDHQNNEEKFATYFDELLQNEEG